MKVEKRDLPAALPMQTRQAAFSPGSVDAEARTVDVVFTTGATVRRRRWVGWDTSIPFDETLEVSRKALDLTRLNAGAPALDSHSTYTSRAQIGVVERAWIDGDKGMATIRFPPAGIDEAADRMWGLVSTGIIRNISVGYSIDKARVIEAEKKGDVEKRIIERWTPHEISFVTVPADAGAQVRSAENGETYPTEIVAIRSATETDADAADENEETRMTIKTNPAPEVRGNEPTVDDAAVRAAQETAAREADERATRAASEAADRAVRAERERSGEIRSMSEQFGLREFGDEHVNKGTAVEEFRKLIIDKLAEKQKEQPETRSAIGSASHIGDVEPEKRAAAIETAILNRIDPATYKLTDDARSFRGMRLIRIAEDCLEARGIRTRGMTDSEIAQRVLEYRSGGMHSSADFPIILSNVANKTLRAAYDAAPQTWRPLVRVTTVPDFKSKTVAQLGEAPDFELVNEHGEFKRGTFGEAAESYKIATYGKVIGFTRQMLINDDMSAFDRIPSALGQRAAQLESDLVWAQILGNPTMGDNVALFHATHKNLGTAAAIGLDAVSAARLAMSKQTGLDGKTVLNISASYIIVPEAQLTKAEQFLAPIVPAQTSNTVPESLRRLTIIHDARLDNGIARAGIAGNANAWYMAAAPSQVDLVEIAYLDGNQGVYTETRMGFDIDGVEIKARLDVGAKVLDHRGLYKNPYAGS